MLSVHVHYYPNFRGSVLSSMDLDRLANELPKIVMEQLDRSVCDTTFSEAGPYDSGDRQITVVVGWPTASCPADANKIGPPLLVKVADCLRDKVIPGNISFRVRAVMTSETDVDRDVVPLQGAEAEVDRMLRGPEALDADVPDKVFDDFSEAIGANPPVGAVDDDPTTLASEAPMCMTCGVPMVKAGSGYACPSCGNTAGFPDDEVDQFDFAKDPPIEVESQPRKVWLAGGPWGFRRGEKIDTPDEPRGKPHMFEG